MSEEDNSHIVSVLSKAIFPLLFVTSSPVAMAVDEQQETQPEITTINTEDEKKAPDTEFSEWYEIYRKHNVENPCDRGVDTYDYEKQWYDETQIYINTKFCEPALWFDNFFSSDRLFEEGVAGTYIRWRNDFTYDEESKTDFKMSLNASVELPGFEDKLRLTFEGDEDEDLRDVSPDNPTGETTTNTLGLQVNVTENVRSKFSAKVSLSPGLLLRYRYTYPISDRITMRFTQELERRKAVNSAKTRVDYEHTMKQNLLFRSSTEGSLSEDFEGVDWIQAFVVYQRLSKRSSIAYESSATGITEPRSLTTNYRLGVRFRRNFHREWLFYEVAPEVTWPISLDESRSEIEISRRSKFLLFFRLEVHFGNAYRRRYQQYN